jgi:hypothetical protein
LLVQFSHLALAQLVTVSQMTSEHLGRCFGQRLLPGVNLMGMGATCALKAGACLRRLANIFCLPARSQRAF